MGTIIEGCSSPKYEIGSLALVVLYNKSLVYVALAICDAAPPSSAIQIFPYAPPPPSPKNQS